RIGVAKADSVVDVGLLEYHLREDLNRRCPRVMAVLRPLKVVIENFPEGEVRELEAPLHPEDTSHGTRKVPLSRVIYIERDDFREDPPKDWFRLAPGREVRLRYACLLKCTDVVKDARGEVVELRCTWDPASWGGTSPDGRVVRGTLHWVSAAHAVRAEVRLYDRLFTSENPGSEEGKSFLDEVNPQSLERLESCWLEPSLATAQVGARYQFERLGYFCVDRDSAPGKLVFNRTVTLKDTWAKIEAKTSGAKASKDAPAKDKAAKDKPAKEKSARDKPAEAPPMVAAAAAGPAAAPAPAEGARADLQPMAPEITIDDFTRIDLRVGIVRKAETVEEAKKLIRLQVDLGEGRLRQIFAGLRAFYPDPSVLVGKRVIVVANLKPRQMKFGLSEGMVLAAGSGDRPHLVATFDEGENAPLPGDRIA
ncbi:MAG TPA: methionine--tRNA ligase subunit beta, partial [Polyangia bacterium]|nr:methionine--tRNA ligase subunit beta [Polyangia bacterium]